MISGSAELDAILEEVGPAELLSKIFAPYRKLLDGLSSIYIFGAGGTGRQLARGLQSKGIKVRAFLDNRRAGETIEGLPCLKPEQAEPGNPIAVATGFQYEIIQQLRAMGRADFIPYTVLGLWYALPRELYLSDLEEIGSFKAKFAVIHDRLGDDLSRRTLLAILRYRTTLDPTHLAEVALAADLQYFDPSIVDISRVKTFVDAGGFDGETTLSFIHHSAGDYDRIFYIEPDPGLYKKSLEKLQGEKGITFLNKALSNAAGVAAFAASGDMQGHLLAAGNEKTNPETIRVECVALDTVVPGQVDLVKLDIEGAECDALRGAARILQGRPILALAYDHSSRDLWKVIETVDLLLPGCRYFVRHYGTTVTETVLYAIPE